MVSNQGQGKRVTCFKVSQRSPIKWRGSKPLQYIWQWACGEAAFLFFILLPAEFPKFAGPCHKPPGVTAKASLVNTGC